MGSTLLSHSGLSVLGVRDVFSLNSLTEAGYLSLQSLIKVSLTLIEVLFIIEGYHTYHVIHDYAVGAET